MAYDFETAHRRFSSSLGGGIGSTKWDNVEKFGFGSDPDVIPFSVADMEFPIAPEVKKALIEQMEHDTLGYCHATPEYRASICRWMKERRHWDAKPEWMVFTHGCVDAFFAAVKAFTNPGDGVMLITPVYYPMYKAINRNGRVLVECPLVRDEEHLTYNIDWDDFEKKAKDANTKLLILCSPHNPVSRVWSREELEKVDRICRENDVFVVSDEIHHDLIMPGHEHVVFASLSEEAAKNCMVLTAPSKTFNLAGLETSNIFVPDAKRRKSFVNEIETGCSYARCSCLGFVACKTAYDQCGAWLDECINVIDTNRKVITEFFAKEFPQIKVYDLQATYLLWMDWRGLGIDYKELERINQYEAGLVFDEGYVFGPAGEGFERWDLAVPTKYVEKALERMKKAYAPYLNK